MFNCQACGQLIENPNFMPDPFSPSEIGSVDTLSFRRVPGERISPVYLDNPANQINVLIPLLVHALKT